MKKPLTFDELLLLMKSRGLEITDEDKCLDFLRSVNYYWLSAYFLPFKQKDNTYLPGTTFEKVHSIFEFDRKLRALLLLIIEDIELYLRAQFAYHSAHTHGSTAYLGKEHYNDKLHNHDVFKKAVEAAIHNNRNTPIVQHHNAKYGGVFPVWVIVDFLSIGNLSYFFADWLVEDKKHVAKMLFNTTYPFLDSWMKCITVLRNRCAHYSRLYFSMFTDTPKIPTAIQYKCTGRVYDQILMLKFLYPHKEKWNSSFMLLLRTLVSEYKNSISLEHIGFPDNWYVLLEYTGEDK